MPLTEADRDTVAENLPSPYTPPLNYSLGRVTPPKNLGQAFGILMPPPRSIEAVGCDWVLPKCFHQEPSVRCGNRGFCGCLHVL